MKRFVRALGLLVAAPAWALVNGSELAGKSDLVRLRFAGDQAVCTGFFVRPDLLLTAAHCLHREPGKLWAIGDLVIEGVSGSVSKAVAFVPHPDYRKGEVTHDVGLVRTENYPAFAGDFVPGEATPERLGRSMIFGTGKVDLERKLYGRSLGSAPYLRLFSVLYTFGRSRSDDQPGKGVSIAPNDSGAPIVDEASGKVIAIAAKSSIDVSYGTFLPALGISALLSDTKNQNFLHEQMKR